jgi:hypothetical protein
MSTSMIDSGSLLAIDVGTITTRVVLFDVVDGSYRFVASHQAPTTADAPFKDIREGVRQALDNLESITGRTFFDREHNLISPMRDGQGVDLVGVSMSAGPAIRTVLVGLLEDVSLESARHLASSTYTQVVDTISLNDRRNPGEQIDSVLQVKPDLFIIAGGTEGGATRSLNRLVEITGLICQVLPEDKRPVVLFAGNKNLANQVRTGLETVVSKLFFSPNLRPTIEDEDLNPAGPILNQIHSHIRNNQVKGVEEMNYWSAGTMVSTSYAMGRMIRFLSQEAKGGVLGVDIGAGHTTVAAAYAGHLSLGVNPQLGLGVGLPGLLRHTSLEDILRWSPLEFSTEDVENYLQQKSIYPASVPATAEDLALEEAIACQALRIAFQKVIKDSPSTATKAASHMPPYFQIIFAAGSVITRASSEGHSLRLLLDAIQPMGISTIVLDQNNLLPALGVAAARAPILPVQVLDTPAFRYLATVVSPYAGVRPGTPILNVRLVQENGEETRKEIKQGDLEVLALAPGKAGQLFLEPLHQADIGMGAGRTRNDGFAVSGTIMGVVIDGRGRPIYLPTEPGRRSELIHGWAKVLGDAV